jgi:hypothetical protein
MVRNQYKQALDLFNVVVQSAMSRDLRLQALFLQSIALQTVGDSRRFAKAQEQLVETDPDHPTSVALIQNQLVRIEGCWIWSKPMFYGCASEGEACSASSPDPTQPAGIVRPCARALRRGSAPVGRHRRDSNFLQTAFQFDQYYAKGNPEIAAELWIVRARHLRDHRRTEDRSGSSARSPKGKSAPARPVGASPRWSNWGGTYAWDGKPAEAERWFQLVMDTEGSDETTSPQALLDGWSPHPVPSRRQGALAGRSRSQVVSRGRSVSRQAFLKEIFDSAGLYRAMNTPEGLNSRFHALLALGALQKGDLVRWHQSVDELVRRYPYERPLGHPACRRVGRNPDSPAPGLAGSSPAGCGAAERLTASPQAFDYGVTFPFLS